MRLLILNPIQFFKLPIKMFNINYLEKPFSSTLYYSLFKTQLAGNSYYKRCDLQAPMIKTCLIAMMRVWSLQWKSVFKSTGVMCFTNILGVLRGPRDVRNHARIGAFARAYGSAFGIPNIEKLRGRVLEEHMTQEGTRMMNLVFTT